MDTIDRINRWMLISTMRDFDYSMLDGHALRTFLMVLEEGSVTRAAERLGYTQSAVSHTLDKLRSVLGDPLFVRSGRGILATERAKSLHGPIQAVLDDLKALTDDRTFEPDSARMEFTIAANDFQRELLFPALTNALDRDGIDVRFRFLAPGVPAANLLHEARCQFIVTPLPPDGSEIFQLQLFRDRMVCFFDPRMRDAPRSWKEYIESDYIDVRFPNHTSAFSALGSVDLSELKPPRITVPNFGDIAAFMKGTRLITTQMSSMQLIQLADFDLAELPFECDPIVLYLIWHRRDQNDPAHNWLKSKIKEQADLAILGFRDRAT